MAHKVTTKVVWESCKTGTIYETREAAMAANDADPTDDCFKKITIENITHT